MSRSRFMILDANVQQSTKILGDLLKCTSNDKVAAHAKGSQFHVRTRLSSCIKVVVLWLYHYISALYSLICRYSL